MYDVSVVACKVVERADADSTDPDRADLGRADLDKVLGPLEGDDVRVAGLFGGGLSRQTEDGWTVDALPLTWPDERLVLCPPGQTMFWAPDGQADPICLPGSATSLVAYGFSPAGRSLVVATSSDVAIFHRP